jgi:tight adherence protein C
MDFVLIGLIFAAATSLGLAGMSVLGQSRVRERLVRLSDQPEPQPSRLTRARTALANRESSWLSNLLGKLGSTAAPGKAESAGLLRERLIHAGYRGPSAVSAYMGLRIVMAVALPLVILVAPPAWALPEWQITGMLCGATGLGYLLPSWMLGKAVNRRQLKIQRGLPDALDLMVVCVEAGFGINASLARVADEFAASHPVLSAELELVTLEIRAGKSTVEALHALALRTGVADIRSLVAMLVQTERFGTSVADALRVHADAMRVQRKAPLKMIFPTVLIFAATIIVLLAPAVFRFNGMFEK